MGDLNACASQLDHGFTMTDAQFYTSNWSKWIRGMLGLGSPDPPRFLFWFDPPNRKFRCFCACDLSLLAPDALIHASSAGLCAASK